jgi:hypothetical protein
LLPDVHDSGLHARNWIIIRGSGIRKGNPLLAIEMICTYRLCLRGSTGKLHPKWSGLLVTDPPSAPPSLEVLRPHAYLEVILCPSP